MPTSDIKKGPLYVDSANNRVGIGNASPSVDLHAKNASGNLEIRFDSDSARNIVFADNNGTYDAQIEAQANGTLYIATRQAQPMLFAINNSEKMRIKSDGTFQLTSDASGSDALEGSITAYNVPQAQVNSRIDFLTDTYQNTGQIKLRTNFGASTKDGLIVNEHAYVTMPFQPAFTAKFNTGVNHTTDAVMIFPTTTSNIGNHYSTSTGLFTAPVAGTYLFTWNLLSNEAASNYCYSRLLINGSTAYYNQEYQNTSVDTGLSSGASIVVSLSANDTVGIFAFGGATQFYGGSNGDYTWWSGSLLG